MTKEKRKAHAALYELQAKLLYAMMVAGKSADFTDQALRRFLGIIGEGKRNELPLTALSRMSWNFTYDCLRKARTGNYGKLATGFYQLSRAKLDLRTATPEQLEVIHGIGPKTSRFFVIWTRPDERYAALDVHILRWMRAEGYDVPATTPSGRRYAVVERWFVEKADKIGLTPRELDRRIWEAGAGRTQLKAA